MDGARAATAGALLEPISSNSDARDGSPSGALDGALNGACSEGAPGSDADAHAHAESGAFDRGAAAALDVLAVQDASAEPVAGTAAA